MIVQRISVQIKAGKIAEALEMAKEARRIGALPGRIYSSISGAGNMVVFENVAENTAELDKLWEELVANEEWAPFHARWDKVKEEKSTIEMWNLVDEVR